MANPFRWGKRRGEVGRFAFVIDLRAAIAEMIGSMFFVFLACGAVSANRGVLWGAIAFGIGITAMNYAISHHSGAELNCAVTLSLVIAGIQPLWQGIANFFAQFFGSILGAVMVVCVFPCQRDQSPGGLGVNFVMNNFETWNALMGEIVGTFILVYVVWETALSPHQKVPLNSATAVGAAYFLIHIVMIPVDGCSLNPTRSIGPAIVNSIRNCDNKNSSGAWDDMWVFWLGPILGSIFATLLQIPMNRSKK